MKAYFYSWHSFLGRNTRIIALILSVCIAVILGIRCGVAAGDSFLPLVRSAAQSPVSTVRLLYSSLLPFLAAMIAVIYSKAVLLVPVCFLKILGFSICLTSVYIAFGSAGWLVSCLLMGSNAFSVLALLRYSIRHVSGFRSTAISDLAVSVATVLGISLLDRYFIAPFLAAVMNY